MKRCEKIERRHESLARGEGRRLALLHLGPGRLVWCNPVHQRGPGRAGNPDANLLFSKRKLAGQASGTMWRLNINSATQAALKYRSRKEIQEVIFSIKINSQILVSFKLVCWPKQPRSYK